MIPAGFQNVSDCRAEVIRPSRRVCGAGSREGSREQGGRSSCIGDSLGNAARAVATPLGAAMNALAPLAGIEVVA